MRHPLIAKLIGFVFLCPISINYAFSKNLNNQLLSDQLEIVLNQKNYASMKDLFIEKSFNQFDKQYQEFSKKYQDSIWSVKTVSNYKNKAILDIKIISKREIAEQIYNVRSMQTIELETLRNKIKSYKVISQESILNTIKSPLIVNVIAPDQVKTGERYEINLIIESPLDNSLIASGIIVLNNNEKVNISNDFFGIKPNQSGGLFKYIKAPYEVGSQTISAIITHPEGIYSITKKIKVGL